jgi:hypothetical protein
MKKEEFRSYIGNFEFSELFRIQGWDNFNYNTQIEVQNVVYKLTGITQKRQFPILLITSTQGGMPSLAIRKQFEKKIKPLYHDHLLIFTNTEKTTQFWQLPLYEDGKFKKLITFSWHKGQDVEGLFQKLRNIVFQLEEEDVITLADVKERVNTLSANSEKVIKTFYAEFSKQHKAFLGFIKGMEDAIPDGENNKKQWYASLMLNRLMFCYFIQKKGFLDNDVNYLSEKMKECKKHLGKNNFYGFYRSFLLELFHNELGRPQDKRLQTASPVPFGVIPYLNGGLFDLHELESAYPKIAIKDEAFEKVFAFFDEWNWHLDTRTSASGKDINPDVIGYIFEKYINQKEMGAYYTKEDITDYIGKNTIVPFLLDKVKTWYPAPFERGGGFWQYLQDSGDEYIYDSVKKGGEGFASLDDVNIPENIRIGIDTKKPDLLERRKDWNTASPDDIGLPTEIWRETISRLQRYFELREKITKGAIQEINDLVTYNLNIRKLAQDYLEQTQDSMFIRKFYIALCGITVLDPTCGSGAFLFAALNILEPLYEICIQRMEEWHKSNPEGNSDFEQRLVPIHSGEHTNLSYYIYKTIILNNLYGVDLMKEAVEIAKLRLFLKLVAEVDPSRRKKNCGLEPLPDIDFNIRSGNTLVGFATERQLEEVVKSTEGDLVYKEKLEGLKTACKSVEKVFEHFQKIQTETSFDNSAHKESKTALTNELKELDEKLNRYLAETYGLGANTQWKSKKEKESAYQAWKESHQPFHWLAEFYGIISKGGFDVVIGNPPYVEYSERNVSYIINADSLSTYATKNLYSYVFARAKTLLHQNSFISMIVQISSISTPNMELMTQEILSGSSANWISNYATRPACLFEGVTMNLSIITSKIINNSPIRIFSTYYNRWQQQHREIVFDCLKFVEVAHCNLLFKFAIPKFHCNTDNDILTKLRTNKTKLQSYLDDGKEEVAENRLYYRTAGGRYFKIFIDTSFGTESKSNKDKAFLPEYSVYAIIAILNSNLWWYYYTLHFDMYNCKDYMMYNFPFDYDNYNNIDGLISLGKTICDSMLKNAERKFQNYKTTGVREQLIFKPSLSKPIIDEIDKVLAKHYGFTEEELDFIINYDIKYRMGSELEGTE